MESLWQRIALDTSFCILTKESVFFLFHRSAEKLIKKPIEVAFCMVHLQKEPLPNVPSFLFFLVIFKVVRAHDIDETNAESKPNISREKRPIYTREKNHLHMRSNYMCSVYDS